MMRDGTRGRVKAEFLDSGEHIEVCAEEILEKGSSTGVYVVEGKISIDNGDSMNQGDFVLFQENSILRNFGDETAVIVRADIHNY